MARMDTSRATALASSKEIAVEVVVVAVVASAITAMRRVTSLASAQSLVRAAVDVVEITRW